ncbi:MAG: hypothetical protein JWM68_3891 [Verrucomicrobiales bacterium]|nr:hypothetical protein [Verrucomicrobiales bacterium]
MNWQKRILILLAALLVGATFAAECAEVKPVSMAKWAKRKPVDVSIAEVSDYVFGNFDGQLPSPPHADLNAKRAFIVSWKRFPFRFVFAHEGSYCPWIEFPSGAGHCFQFFEGNDGWAELFNNFGRKEENSFVDVLENGPERVWVRWTYFGVNQTTGQRAYRGNEDFWAFPNGHILRRQSFESLMPRDPHGYAREPIEMIGMCPKGKLWFDVLQRDPASGDSHSLAVMDVFSTNRYDVFWKRKPDSLWQSTVRRTGCDWKTLDDSRGVVLITPLREGAAFCVLGDIGGFRHESTRIKDHSFKDTGGIGWGSQSWDHWPIGWLNSQANEVNADSLQKYPNHFSPAGMDMFALPNEQVERRDFYSLIGVAGDDLEAVRKTARHWLDAGASGIPDLKSVSRLGATAR